jgi:cytochrome b pre-mRNA-processing protein 3
MLASVLGRLLSRLRRSSDLPPGGALYFALVQQARSPVFFREWRVPDTVDGRFDMVVLHAALLFRRLRALGPEAQGLADETFAAMTGDLDRSVRELGGGDLGVGRRMKAIGQAFYGRVRAYDAALAGTQPLEEVLRRNVYREAPVGEDAVSRLAAYVRGAVQRLDQRTLSDLAAANPDFPSAE